MGSISLGVALVVCASAALFGLLIGRWRGRQIEATEWRNCAILPEDHMRSAGKDYKVLLLDRFYRDYHNPLVRSRHLAARDVDDAWKAQAAWPGRNARGIDLVEPTEAERRNLGL